MSFIELRTLFAILAIAGFLILILQPYLRK